MSVLTMLGVYVLSILVSAPLTLAFMICVDIDANEKNEDYRLTITRGNILQALLISVAPVLNVFSAIMGLSSVFVTSITYL